MNTAANTTPTATTDASLAGARSWFAERGLSRPRKGRLLGGVSAGLARRYDVNVFAMRVGAILSLFLVTPLPYIALWILMPRDAG